MIATRDVTASWDGRRYAFKKGEKVEAPKALVSALKAQGAAKAHATKKETEDD